jgi:hypothetical protein
VAQLSRYQRTLLRLQGKPSSDPRDVRRRLRKALEASSRRSADAGQVDEVQLFGEALDSKKYRQWARRHGGAPELTPGAYALVLHAMPPAHVERFLRRGKYTELFGPSHVGMFQPSVEAEDALAGTVATWLERQDERLVAPAPPVLRMHTEGQREDRIVDFGLPWPLPTHDAVGA